MFLGRHDVSRIIFIVIVILVQYQLLVCFQEIEPNGGAFLRLVRYFPTRTYLDKLSACHGNRPKLLIGLWPFYSDFTLAAEFLFYKPILI